MKIFSWHWWLGLPEPVKEDKQAKIYEYWRKKEHQKDEQEKTKMTKKKVATHKIDDIFKFSVKEIDGKVRVEIASNIHDDRYGYMEASSWYFNTSAVQTVIDKLVAYRDMAIELEKRLTPPEPEPTKPDKPDFKLLNFEQKEPDNVS